MDTYRDDGKCVLCKTREAELWVKHPGSLFPVRMCAKCGKRIKKQKRQNTENVGASERKSVVYCIGEKGTEFVKIGRTHCVNCLWERLAALKTANPRELAVLALWRNWSEVEIHRKFADSRVQGEWFIRTPEMEEFMLLGPAPIKPEKQNFTGRAREWAKEHRGAKTA